MYIEDVLLFKKSEKGIEFKECSGALSQGPSSVVGNVSCNKYVEMCDILGKYYIIKKYRDINYEYSIVNNKQIEFSSMLNNCGLWTTKNLKSSKNIYNVWYSNKRELINIQEYEEYINVHELDRLKWINLIAEMHYLAEKNSMKIGERACWYNAFNHNEIIRLDKLTRDCQNNNMRHTAQLIEFGNKIYNQAFDLAFQLTEYAVHGDLVVENIMHDGKGKYGVIDFDQAGDSILVSDFVLQASKFVDEYLYNFDRYYQAFSEMRKIYESTRELTTLEKKMFEILVVLVYVFNYKKINCLRHNLDNNNRIISDGLRVLENFIFSL